MDLKIKCTDKYTGSGQLISVGTLKVVKIERCILLTME